MTHHPSHWEDRVRRNNGALAAWVATAGFLAFAASGCCMHSRSRCEPQAEPPEVAEVVEAEPQGPPGPEYPRFHPVPTRPVFAPEGVEFAPAPSTSEASTSPQASSNEGWHSAGTGSGGSPNWVFASSMPESDLRKMEPSVERPTDNRRAGRSALSR